MRKRVHGVGNKHAKIMIVGMGPARNEITKGVPFVGASGQMLNKALAINGINRNDCYITNILEWEIPFGNTIFGKDATCITHPKNGYATVQEVSDEVSRLKTEIEAVKPNVIFALGNDPLQVLCSRYGVMNWRGSILESTLVPGQKVVIGIHPAGIQQGMWKWEKVFDYVDTARVKQESLQPGIDLPKRHAIIRPSFTEALDYLAMCNEQEWVSFDIETIWWSEAKMGHIACVSFSVREDEAISIPLVFNGGQPYWGQEHEVCVWKAIASLLQNKKVKKLGQNVSFDTLYFWFHKIYPFPVSIDTMLLHHCLYPDFGGIEDSTFGGMKRKRNIMNPGHSLRLLTSIYTRSPYYKADGREWDPSMGDDRFWRYNAMDAMVTYECAMKMMAEAKEDGLWDFYNEHYMSHFYPALRMEWEGIAIDLEKRNVGRAALLTRASELQRRINDTLGYELNVASPKQMSNMLYKHKGFQVKKKHGTQRVTADKNVLQYFAKKKNDPVLFDIIELKQVLDEISDVFDVPLGDDGRIRCHYKIGGAGGSRWSSTASIIGSGTNLQNVRRDGLARELFLAT